MHYGSTGYEELKESESPLLRPGFDEITGGAPPKESEYLNVNRRTRSLLPRYCGFLVLFAVFLVIFLPIFTSDTKRHTRHEYVPSPEDRDSDDFAPVLVASFGEGEYEFDLYCHGWLDDLDFNPFHCGKPDYTLFCPELCAAGTACADICGEACASEEDSWAAYCVMDAFANLEETCAGTYDPQPPARRLGDEKSKEKKPDIDEDEVNWTQSCGTHAMCTGCDDMKNEGCRAIFEELQSIIWQPEYNLFRAKIAYGIQLGEMGEPKPSVQNIAHWSLMPTMLEPAYLRSACEKMGYAYAPRLGWDGDWLRPPPVEYRYPGDVIV